MSAGLPLASLRSRRGLKQRTKSEIFGARMCVFAAYARGRLEHNLQVPPAIESALQIPVAEDSSFEDAKTVQVFPLTVLCLLEKLRFLLGESVCVEQLIFAELRKNPK